MEYLPVFLRLAGRTVAVIGGGRIALRKARLLASAGGVLRVVAPNIDEELAQLSRDGDGECRYAPFEPDALDGVALVVVATGDRVVDRAVYEAARARNLPVNVADDPELCTFILPSIVDRSPLMIAISSGGRAPVLVRWLRARLESRIPAAIGRLADFLGRHRAAIRAQLPDAVARVRLWERIVEGPVAGRVLAGDETGALALLGRELQTGADESGEVYLVGAGPGDPDLLTFRALKLMQQADIVFYDRLVSAPILELVRREAERVYVGKRRGEHAVAQPDINGLLVSHARAGKRVLRLKGGDPFIFGRGGEEIEHLAENGIAFQVVPGITAASGCAAYAGIPLTHRDFAQSVRFVAGHLRDGTLSLDWASLCAAEQTLVFYMSLTGLPTICAELIRHGMDPAMPVAMIQQGTTPDQRVLVSTLRQMPGALAEAGMRAPTLTIIGRVVSLRDRLKWFRPDGDAAARSEHESEA